MSLVVGAETAISDTVETIIATYTASAGDFSRGFKVWGEREAEVAVKIDGVVKHVDAIGNLVDGDDRKTCGYSYTAIALAASEVLTIQVTKTNDPGTDAFRGVLY